MVVEGHLGDPGFGQDLVDPGGAVAVPIEQLERGVDQLVAFRRGHGFPVILALNTNLSV